MSLLSQLEEYVAEGKIAKAGKPAKRKPKKPVNPNIAKKYRRPGHTIPGDPQGFRTYQPTPAVPKPVKHRETVRISDDKFVAVRPPSILEQFGHKTAVVLVPDDIEVIEKVCKALKKKNIPTLEAIKLIKFVLKEALHIDGYNLAVLKDNPLPTHEE